VAFLGVSYQVSRRVQKHHKTVYGETGCQNVFTKESVTKNPMYFFLKAPYCVFGFFLAWRVQNTPPKTRGFLPWTSISMEKLRQQKVRTYIRRSFKQNAPWRPWRGHGHGHVAMCHAPWQQAAGSTQHEHCRGACVRARAQSTERATASQGALTREGRGGLG
jgi:hypothetical protein